MLFKMDVKPNFTVENEAAISAPPKVDFDKTPPAPPAPAPAQKSDAGAEPKVAAAPDAGCRAPEEGLLTPGGAIAVAPGRSRHGSHPFGHVRARCRRA